MEYAAVDREATDWNKVLPVSSEILTQQSKDLLVLVYSIRSIIAAYRYEGMARSIELLPLYIDLYWSSSFPLLKRKRARRGALEWLTQQLEFWLENNEPVIDDKVYLERVTTGFKTLNNKLADYGDEWPLDTFTITRKLDAYLLSFQNNAVVSSCSATPDLDKPKVAPQRLITPLAQTNNVLLDVVDDKSFQSGVRCVQSHLKLLAQYRLSKDINDPLAYEINRFSTWLPIVELPQHKEKITPLRPVPIEKRQAYEALYQQKQYESLITEVESSLSSSPFWLDGQRLVVESLRAIEAGENKPYQKAVDSISNQVNAFIARLDGIEQLCFSDGTPFADTDTLTWLASIAPRNSSVSEINLQDPDIVFIQKQEKVENDRCDDVQAVLAEAQSLFRENRFTEGLSKLDAYCKTVMSKNSWFQARMLMAKYCLSAKEYVTAEQLLIELDEISVNHKLDRWEPETVIELLSMMLICKNKLKRKQEAKAYFNRLSRLDVMQAYKIKQGE